MQSPVHEGRGVVRRKAAHVRGGRRSMNVSTQTARSWTRLGRRLTRAADPMQNIHASFTGEGETNLNTVVSRGEHDGLYPSKTRFTRARFPQLVDGEERVRNSGGTAAPAESDSGVVSHTDRAGPWGCHPRACKRARCHRRREWCQHKGAD